METVDAKKAKKVEIVNRDRRKQKTFWSNGYRNCSINRDSLEFILNNIRQMTEKTPAKIVANPTESHKQLILMIYKLAHGCSFKVLKDLFGVSQARATEIIRVLVITLHNKFAHLPNSEDEWIKECKGFNESYKVPCVHGMCFMSILQHA